MARTNTRNSYYVHGTAVRRPQTIRELENAPAPRKLSNRTRKNREKAGHMNAGYVIFLTAALVATGIILASYIRLQSDITNSIQHISTLESQLNQIKVANDEEYSRITSSVDIEEVRRIAIQELGMSYAQEGQVINYSSENNDYVKQMASIPK